MTPEQFKKYVRDAVREELAITDVPVIEFKRTHDHTLPVPEYKTSGAAGMDVHACIQAQTLNLPDNGGTMSGLTHVLIPPGSRSLIQTGFSANIPDGYEIQVRSRSGLALKDGIVVLNAPGTVDSDYTGEIGVIIANTGTTPFVVKHGDRIAQLVVARALRAATQEIKTDLKVTDRGAGGYGHTGV
jgi:dUTP pyrophosphatase